MTCERIKLPDGEVAIVCSRGGKASLMRCVKCGCVAECLCDWKLSVGTCDRPICGGCSVSPAPGKDLCPTHAEAWEHHPQNRQVPLSLDPPA